MNFETQLKESLQEKGRELIPSPDLKGKVMRNITTVNGKFKKRLVMSLLVALLVIPTSAFAYQSFLADEIYHSFENVKKHISSAAMEGYLLLNAKLSQAKGELGKEDYEEFKEQLKIVANSKIEYADKFGNIDYAHVPAEKAAEIKGALLTIQPIFDKLNGQPSSKEILAAEEYNKYIDALMTYEKVLAQSGVNPSDGPVEMDMILPDLQSEFEGAKDFINYVNEMQQ
ncbi:DUF3600 domain-containing protein [Cytobacillus depressus]|uniref:DUF3600 domain-containing protein n=1 Tax=Cytobacillus depressus TaxID=1602942 RepID=A0A6L3V4F6_9BACI|nr:DUF3600 domain-containing protein [Cytobacillus depressus]KAB2334880.1 DUF3600 domain-containing protein [Cytobacillus depressus]